MIVYFTIILYFLLAAHAVQVEIEADSKSSS